jgi:putative tryptophan/tyrosine transport system substrate-binding protein
VERAEKNMRRKITGLALGALLFALSVPAEAQQPTKVRRIGFLIAGPRSSYSTRIEAFLQGLRELGYIEGKNIAIEYRYAEGKLDRLPDLAAELARLKVDVIVTAGGTPSLLAAKNATRIIPIVFAVNTDPVGSGFVASLGRPGGSITGLSLVAPELSGKRLELLKETVPKVSRVAVLLNPTAAAMGAISAETQKVAASLGVQLQLVEARSPNELDPAFSAVTREHASALVVASDPMFFDILTRIVSHAAKNRLPAMYFDGAFVDAGGLMSYGPNIPDLYRRAAIYVDKILKGAKPADLPVEQPTKFELVINLKTAKQIGLTIPPNVLLRADKVIK